MASNVNSRGVPVDQDGEPLEYGVIGGAVAPFAVRSDVFRELFMEHENQRNSHLETEPLGPVERPSVADLPSGSWNRSSLVGGIPIERVEIEDVDEGYQSEEYASPVQKESVNHTSATVHAVLRTTKHERDELCSTRRKLQDVLSFLRGKGFTEEQVLAQSQLEGFGSKPPVRDEYGLPVIQPSGGKVPPTSDPFKDKMKGKVEDKGPDLGADGVFDKKSEKKSEKSDAAPTKSWSQVVNDSPPVPPIKFDFIPKSVGAKVISPPVEVLKQGNDKFKNCLVGVFSKGYLPYNKVNEFANKNWSSKGLLHVSQKDNRTFIFKFRSQSDVMGVLARGTWFIDRRPLIVHLWGTSSDTKQHLPLWVRFDKVPDCYWTREGLSWLASSIGTPLCADENTSKLEVLPFAKLCINYQIGDDLPTTLDVEVLDPVLDKIITAQVLVSYPAKPLVCSACKSLGHLIGACPRTVRHWVRKSEVVQPQPDAGISTPTAGVSTVEKGEVPDQPPSQVACEDGSIEGKADHESGWTEIKRKKDVVTMDASPSPPVTFKNLKNVDEIDKRKGALAGTFGGNRLTKSQKKRLRLQGSSSSPNSTT